MLLENFAYPEDTRVHLEASTLAAAGYRVCVICPADLEQSRRESVGSVRVYRYPAPRGGNGFFGYLWEYGYAMLATFVLSLRVWVRDGFDVLHAHNPPDTFVLIALFYKLFGKRFVFDQHDLSPEMYLARLRSRGNRLVHQVLVLFEKLSCRMADLVITTNESHKLVQMQRDGVPEKRIAVVRTGPDLSRLRVVHPHSWLRQKGVTIIGYLGVMGFQDGVDYLLRALHHLVHDLGRADFFCVLVGGGDAWADLNVLSRQLGLETHVRFTGHLPYDDVLPYLSAADICVVPDPANPYNDRSTMIKLMEYMALGKPVVAFDLPEHRFTAQSAVAYVRPNDELAFAQTLAALMDDPVRREAMGMFGRSRVETVLAWKYSAPKLIQAYSQLLSIQGESVMAANPLASTAAPPEKSAEEARNAAAP
jgi:glycosyltransferase involved in cell wall biosynthesis